MLIARETLSVFEFGRKPFQAILVVFLDRKKQKSQRISVSISTITSLPSLCVYTPLHHWSKGVYPRSDGRLAMAFNEYIYRCIERFSGSVGTLLCCDCGMHSLKWLSIEKVGFFRLNSNMSNISFAMGMFSYQNWLKCSVGTLIFCVFR